MRYFNMWFEGRPLRWMEPTQELEEYYKKYEHIVPDLNSFDDTELVNDDPQTIMDDTRIPYVEVPINVPHKDIFEEANHLLYTSCFTAHRPGSTGWLSLAIHGISSVHTNCAEDYNLPDDYEETDSHWTDIAKFCPRTVEWMKDEMLYEQFARVRFMAVLPGGWIGQHIDRHSTKGIGATNVAINNPDGCAMVMEDIGTVPFAPGKVIKLNTGYNHAVWNRSDEPRIHMIFDGNPSKQFKERFKQGYAKMLNV